MLNKLNRKNIVFISVSFLIGVLLALAFEFIVNKVFPQPRFFFSRSRCAVVASLVAGAIILIRYRKYFRTHLHHAFLLIALVIGAASIITFPRTVYLSPDDQIHFRNAYFFMDDTIELRGGFTVIESAALTDSVGKGFDEMSVVYEIMNEAEEKVVDEEYHIDGSPRLYNHLAYLPYYIGFKISTLLRFRFTTSVIVAKICNLLLYTVLIYFAIKLSGRFNRIFFVIGLLTCNIFLATQFSYDPLVISSLLLAIALFLHIMQSDKASMKYLLGFVGAATLGSLTKAIYCPILLLVLMIPNHKFDCRRRAIAFKVCTLLVMLVLASTFVLPILGGGLASDIRGGSTSVSGQISFILNNPIKAFAIILNYITGTLPKVLLGPTSFVGLGAGVIYETCKSVVQLVGTMSLTMLLWITFNTYLDKQVFTKASKVGLAVIFSILVGGIIASMYLSFTPVGNIYVYGIQERYFMPFLLLLFIILMPMKKSKCQESSYDYLTLFIPALCLALILAVYILRMSML